MDFRRPPSRFPVIVGNPYQRTIVRAKRRGSILAGLARGDLASVGWMMAAAFAVALGVMRAPVTEGEATELSARQGSIALMAAVEPRRATREIDADIDARRMRRRDEPTVVSGVDTLRASFTLCHSGGGRNCVVDGDTFWFAGRKVRIADIDTPEIHPPRCAAEAARGAAATQRLQALLNAGPFSLDRIDRDTDHYGRQLRVVTRGGASVGGILVDEGLARWYGGRVRDGWC